MHPRVFLTASSVSLCSLVACSGSTAEVGDTTGGTTSSSGGSSDVSDGSDGSTDPTLATSSEVTGSSGGSSEGSSDPTLTTSGVSDDTTTGEVVQGPWCGYAGTGQRALEDAAGQGVLPLSAHLGGPTALPLWYYDDGGGRGLRAAVYDTATGTWGDTVTLDAGGEVELWGESTGAVDGEGNALVVSADNLGEPSVRVHRYDAAAASWTASTLEAGLTILQKVSVTVDADGDAVVLAWNELEFGVSTFVQWFYDVATDTWTAPEVIGPIESYGPAASWAQDRASGDAAFLMDVTGDVIQLRHRAAATGEWTTQDIDTSGQSYVSPAGVVAVGDDRFVAITTSGNFGADDGQVTGFVFEDGVWQSAFVLDAGVSPSNVSISGDQDGRVLVAWNAHPTSIRGRSYDAGTGWSPLLVVNAGQEGANYIVQTRTALDDGGFVVGWSQLHDNGQRTYVRRHDEDGWGPIVDVDPDQPALSSIAALHGIAADDTRVVWARDAGNANYTGWYYACHAPDGEWSEPSAIDLEYPRFEAHTDGEFLAVGWEGNALVAEYFAAP